MTCGQAISRCQRVTQSVKTMITVQNCLLPLECRSRRIRPASLTWSGEDRDRDISINFARICVVQNSCAEKHNKTEIPL